MGGKLLHAAIVGAGAAAIALILWTAGLLNMWEFGLWRWRVDFFAGPGAATSRIKLVLLDQTSLDWGEKENGWTWPWPREVYAPIIDFCARAGARAIVFDMLFTEPSLYGVEDDRALGRAIERTPVFVVPLFLGRKSGSTEKWPPEVSERYPVKIENFDDWRARLDSEALDGLVMPMAKFPVREISASAILASVSEEPDFDGIFRRSHLFKIFDGHAIASLSLAAFLAGETVPLPAPHPARNGRTAGLVHELKIQDDCLQAAGRCISMDESGKAILRFRGLKGSYQAFSAAEVIQSELRLKEGGRPVIEDAGVFKDSYVIFGASAPGLLDLRPTPISKIAPGVELHATVLDNLVSNDFLRDTPSWISVLTTLFAALLSSFLVVMVRRAWQNALLVGILLLLPTVIGFVAYPLGYWWPIVVHGTAIAIALTGGVFLNYAGEARQKSFIKQAFKYYLSPEVIDKILEDPSKLELGGEHRELSILFSDLQGFSSFSERLDPPTLTGLLNDYLSDMTDIIIDEGGTLDKYEGDAIIAFWNAPVDQPDHARRACRAAIRCQRRLAERRNEFLEKTGTLLLARIGIHTGQVVVGNMGSSKRFNYTILGDAANLASRLEGANKVFRTFTMVSEATWSRTGGEFLGREIALLRVVGRQKPVRVYELIGFSGSEAPEWLELFDSALRQYYTCDWRGALEGFSKVPNDSVARIYARRCRSLLRHPEIQCDGGIWTLKGK